MKLLKKCGSHYVGQQVNQQFAKNIQGNSLTTIIKGEIIKIIETRDAAFATILETDTGKTRLVCLG